MKTKTIELDVDYIGGQEPLTESEEKALSDFFNKHRPVTRKAPTKPTRRKVKRLKEKV